MALRCLLFTSDQGTAEPICQVLAGLGVEGDYCSESAAALEKVANQPFQIVIIDWDAQPEAGLLLAKSRERKASERPLTLAIVSDDASVPKALQAGANSILRKPIMVSQVNDTLTTARDLLRAKQESAASVAQAAAAGASAGSVSHPPAPVNSAPLPASIDHNQDRAGERTLHAGEFLQSSGTIPGAQFVTDSEVHKAADYDAEPVDPHEDLEPVAAAMVEEPAPTSPPPPAPGETRGLQWYLNARAGVAPQIPVKAAPPSTPAQAKPELLGFDQTQAYSDNSSETVSDDTAWAPTPGPVSPRPLGAPAQDSHSSGNDAHEQKAEAKLFAYISGEEEEKSEEKPQRSFRLGKGAIAAALLAACAIAAAPQAPWHPQVRALWAHGQQSLHTWLNPQPVTTAQAPVSHESVSRAGDEYKLPVAENIPDATTDPSQIRVVPVVDPTAKKPNPDPNAPPPEPINTNPTDAAQPPAQGTDPAQANPQPNQTTSTVQAQPAAQTAQPTPTVSTPSPTGEVPAPVEPAHTNPNSANLNPAPSSAVAAAATTAQPRSAPAPTNVPSSLKSQMASMTPEASGNKSPESAMQAIEPVAVAESAERALLTDQPAILYPANATGQQGTVTLQVMIGRDGSVEDAKFLQGSLAFARAAIEGVRLWKFKPYIMNGRPVSVQTTMTMARSSHNPSKRKCLFLCILANGYLRDAMALGLLDNTTLPAPSVE